jgi:hypothetical protein
LVQIVISGCHNAKVDSYRSVAAKPLKFLFLENSQKLGLQFEWQIANFIEKERSCMGVLKSAGCLSQRSSECSAFMAQEFAFQQTAWHCRAVQLDIWTALPKALLMNGLGYKFLARAVRVILGGRISEVRVVQNVKSLSPELQRKIFR